MRWTPEEIKRQRVRRGLSQAEVAELIGASRRAVTNWETGRAEPRGSNLRALANLLDTPATQPGDLQHANAWLRLTAGRTEAEIAHLLDVVATVLQIRDEIAPVIPEPRPGDSQEPRRHAR